MDPREDGASLAAAKGNLARGPMRLIAAILRAIGDWQARGLLALCYYVVLAPFAILARRSKPFEPPGWRTCNEEPPDPARQS